MNRDTKIIKAISIIATTITFFVMEYFLTWGYCEIAIVGAITLCIGMFFMVVFISIYYYAAELERRRENGTGKDV